MTDQKKRAMRDALDSPFNRALRDALDSPFDRALRDALDSPFDKAMRDALDSPFEKAMREAMDSPMMKAIREMQDSPMMKAVREMRDSPMLKAVREMQDSPVMKAMRVMQEPSLKIAARLMQASLKELEGLSASPLFDYLVSGSDRSPRNLLDASVCDQLKLTDFCIGEVVQGGSPQTVADQVIVDHLQRGSDPEALSAPDRDRLSRVFWLLFFIFNYLALQNGIREELCFFQPKLAPDLTANQTGRSVRAFMCEAAVPLDYLRGYRTVKGSGVRLRTAPGMKADVVQVVLADRALLEVLDGSNRDWLHVSVVAEGGLEGWISRKYTHQLLR